MVVLQVQAEQVVHRLRIHIYEERIEDSLKNYSLMYPSNKIFWKHTFYINSTIGEFTPSEEKE